MYSNYSYSLTPYIRIRNTLDGTALNSEMFMFLKYAYKLLCRGPVQLLEKSGICKLLHISKDSVTNKMYRLIKKNIYINIKIVTYKYF